MSVLFSILFTLKNEGKAKPNQRQTDSFFSVNVDGNEFEQQ